MSGRPTLPLLTSVRTLGLAAPAGGFVNTFVKRAIKEMKSMPYLLNAVQHIMACLQEIWLDQADAAAVSEGEEVTLMDWGNAIIRSVQRDASSGAVTAIDAGGLGGVWGCCWLAWCWPGNCRCTIAAVHTSLYNCRWIIA